jgi:hypothetical protein
MLRQVIPDDRSRKKNRDRGAILSKGHQVVQIGFQPVQKIKIKNQETPRIRTHQDGLEHGVLVGGVMNVVSLCGKVRRNLPTLHGGLCDQLNTESAAISFAIAIGMPNALLQYCVSLVFGVDTQVSVSRGDWYKM